MDYQVRLSRSARSDIRDIVRYISIDDPARGLRFELFLKEQIKSFPNAVELCRSLTMMRFAKSSSELIELFTG